MAGPLIARRRLIVTGCVAVAALATNRLLTARASDGQTPTRPAADDGETGQAPAFSNSPGATDLDPAAESEVTRGTREYRGFVLDNVLHAPDEGDVHFNLYVPKAYDGSQDVALFVTLPGYQGLYFQGVGMNVQTEDFGFEAQAYDPQMIVLAPQLSDWGETSARQAIALVERMLRAYAIDEGHVYLEGYSGGGETLSLVMGANLRLFRRALFCSSQWDGDLEALADARVPVYLVVGESDEYYGSEPTARAAGELEGIYRSRGLDEDEIAHLVTLDVKPASYFAAGGVTNQHGHGGALFCRDPQIMGWLFAM